MYIDKLYIYIIICMYIAYLYSWQLTRCTPTWLMNQGWAGLWFKLESVGDLSLSLSWPKWPTYCSSKVRPLWLKSTCLLPVASLRRKEQLLLLFVWDGDKIKVLRWTKLIKIEVENTDSRDSGFLESWELEWPCQD